MSDLYGLPIITSPNLPEGTVVVVNPAVWDKPLFEAGPILGPFVTDARFHFLWRPMASLSMPHSIVSCYSVGPCEDYAEPVKYRGLVRVVHWVRRAWRR